MEFRLLGPVEVRIGDAVAPLGGPRQRAVLAALLLSANRAVPTERLIRRVWTEPPGSAESNARTYLARLRRALRAPGDGESRLARGDAGHVLTVHDGELDLAVFADLSARGERALAAGDAGRAASLFERALELWRGAPFSGCEPEAELLATAARLTERRETLVELHLRARMELGRYGELVGELRELVAASPTRERLVGLLMLALHRSGRQAEALDVYREARERLVEDLGVEPGQELDALYRRLLEGDPAEGGEGAVTAYRQLPPGIAEFTGRDALMRRIAELAGSPHPRAPTILVLEGMGGVGKTRVAVQAAHDLVARGRFADGQLYADLGGFTPDAGPVDPAAVLESFLRLLGVPGRQVPTSLDERATMFRDRLAGTETLLLLDNAASERQVRPLLPAGPGCLALVTSRRSLAVDGAENLCVGLFSEAESLALLDSGIGDARVGEEPDAARELTVLCGQLPLAVSIAARRLRARPQWRVSDLVARLRARTPERLGELAFGDRDVEAVFAMSYEALDSRRRELFRLLGAHPGEDCTDASAAALTGGEVVDTERMLESLLDDHLLVQVVPGRYRMHDLVRGFAAARCRAEVSDEDCRVALTRLLDWYVAAAAVADGRFSTFASVVFGELPTSHVPLPDPPDTAAAVAWLESEHTNLMAALRTAVEGGWNEHAAQLPHLLQIFAFQRRSVREVAPLMAHAVRAARALGDPVMLAHGLTRLANAHFHARDIDKAHTTIAEALAMHRANDDRPGIVTALSGMASMHKSTGDLDDALGCYREALDLSRDLGDVLREATTLSNLGVILFLKKEVEDAIAHQEQALAIQRRHGLKTEASTLTNLGRMCTLVDRYDEGLAHLDKALAMHRSHASKHGEMQTLEDLCLCLSRMGRHDDAIGAGEAALAIARELQAQGMQVDVLNTLGEAYGRAGRGEEAEACFEEAGRMTVGKGA